MSSVSGEKLEPASGFLYTPGQVTKLLLALAAPIVTNNLLTVGMQLTDAVMAGRISAQDLAAISVGGSAYMAFFLFALGMLVALNPTVSHLFGAGETKEIGYMARQGLWLASILSLMLMVGFRFLPSLFRLVGVASVLSNEAASYVIAMAWGLPAMLSYLVLRFASEGIGHTRPMLFVAIAGFLLNIPLDYGFMFGAFGLHGLGAVGCGYASAIVMWVDLIAMLIYVRGNRPRYGQIELFKHFEFPDWTRLAVIVKLGAPIAITLFAEVSLFSVVALLMASLGTVAAAAHQVALSVASVSFMVPMGVSTAISVVVGQALGAGNLHGARQAGLVGIGLCVGFEILAALFILLFRYSIAEMFTADLSVITLAAKLLLLASAFQLSDGLQVASIGALRGFKDTRVPMIVTLIAYWGGGLTVAWWLGLREGWGPIGIWFGLIVGLTLAGGLLFVRYLRRSSVIER